MVKKVSLCGVLVALACIFSYIDSLIPVSTIQGVRLGLANIVIIIAFYMIGVKEAAMINLARIAMMALIVGTGISFAFSLAGAFLSYLVMALFFYINKVIPEDKSFNLIMISEFAALAHVIGQLIVGLVFYNITVVFYYSMAMLFAGAVTGLIIGILSKNIINVLNKVI